MCNINDERNFPHKLVLTDRQISKLRKTFANNLSGNIKLSKIQSSVIIGRLLGPLLKTVLPLMKNVLKKLAKSILIPLGFTASTSAADRRIRKKDLGLGTTTLIIFEQINGRNHEHS